MTSGGGRGQEIDLEALFQNDAPSHIHKSIAAMEDETYGEFRLRMGHDITMSKYWRVNFILAKYMSTRGSFSECMNLMVNNSNEDAEKGMIHMKTLMQLSKPPFNKENKHDKDVSTSKSLEDEAESSRRL